jgi:hypothetical protein
MISRQLLLQAICGCQDIGRGGEGIGYYWVPGTWILPPEAGLLWTPGYWESEEGVYVFHVGYWGPHIGFYGGVNYGFGYDGIVRWLLEERQLLLQQHSEQSHQCYSHERLHQPRYRSHEQCQL